MARANRAARGSVSNAGNAHRISLVSDGAAMSRLLGTLLDQLVVLRLDLSYDMMPRYDRGAFTKEDLQLVADRINAAVLTTKEIVAASEFSPLGERGRGTGTLSSPSPRTSTAGSSASAPKRNSIVTDLAPQPYRTARVAGADESP